MYFDFLSLILAFVNCHDYRVTSVDHDSVADWNDCDCFSNDFDDSVKGCDDCPSSLAVYSGRSDLIHAVASATDAGHSNAVCVIGMVSECAIACDLSTV